MTTDSLTTAEAAQVLGLSQRRVRAMITAGTLNPTGRIGAMWLLDRRQVVGWRRQSQTRADWSATAHTGRRWSETTAWAAIYLLEALPVDLEASALSRLRKRMTGINFDRFVWLGAGRARLQSFDGLEGDASYLRAEIVPTGLQALDEARISSHFDLAAFAHDVDGYVSQEMLSTLVLKYDLTPNPSGKFKLRTVSSERLELLQANGVPPTGIALDLLSEGTVRSRSQAEKLLQERIADFEKRQTA